jgi:purine-nucleoside phosphorylase
MTRSSRYDLRDARTAADFLRDRLPSKAAVAVLAGTGLGEMAAAAVADAVVDYRDIPHFPAATVQSHYGRLAAVTLDGVPLLVLQGRFHLYEGYQPRQVTFPVRVLQALGVHTLILTNAAGGLNPLFSTGDIMVIEDHLNLTGENPLVGPNDDCWGPRFPGMTRAYDLHLQELACAGCAACGRPARKGIYAGLKGPSLETPAEMRYLRTIGADAVGFSTVMESIAAVHAGMRVLGLSVITNSCRPDDPAPADVDEIVAVAQAAAPSLAAVIEHVIKG